MILVLDVGNSQIYCGVFDRGELSVQFRYASTSRSSSDEIEVFLRGALRRTAWRQKRQNHWHFVSLRYPN